MPTRWLLALLVTSAAAACQHDIKTPFPPGLEPLEPNPVPEQTAPYTETLATATGSGSEVQVYAVGYVLADPATVWAATQTPEAVAATCTTDAQSYTVDNEPQYEFSFLVAYTVNDVLTVQWNDQWRYGTIDLEPFFGMIKHQKTDGSSFITDSQGTIKVTATDDPNATELAFVEHLQAIAGSSDDVIKSTTHVFDSIVALSHGGVIPPCP